MSLLSDLELGTLSGVDSVIDFMSKEKRAERSFKL